MFVQRVLWAASCSHVYTNDQLIVKPRSPKSQQRMHSSRPKGNCLRAPRPWHHMVQFVQAPFWCWISTTHVQVLLQSPNAFFAPGCFSATTTANTSFLSVRGSGDSLHFELASISLCAPIKHTLVHLSCDIMCNRSAQDFANQIFCSVEYRKALKEVGGTPGKYVTPRLGEWQTGPWLNHKHLKSCL